MKKILLAIAIVSVFAVSCGPAVNLSSSSASSSASTSAGTMVSFVTNSGTPVDVTVDNNYHGVVSVKKSTWQRDRNFQRDSRNAILLAPGEHDIVVKMNGKEVYKGKVNVSAQEKKVIELE